MKQENTPTLETGRLLLRKFTPGDAQALLSLLGDGETNIFLPWFPLRTLGEATSFLEERFLSWYRRPSAYRYAICQKGDDTPIGYVWLGDGESRDFGYGLAREHWHKGIVTEAARAVADRIKAAGIPYITATHDVQNPRSGAVMQKLGMTYRYSFKEQWQPKNIPVTFRMYQLDFDQTAETFMGYWNQYSTHFIEQF